MKKFLGAVVSVGAFVILVGAAVAHTERNSGHNMDHSREQMSKAGCDEMMNNHMSKIGHDMTSHAGKTGHDMKIHTHKADHHMKSHGGNSGNE